MAISSGANAVPSVTGDCSGSAAPVATGTLSYDSVAPTVTTDVGGVTSVVGPGPEGTGGATTTGKLCSTCTKATKTGTAAGSKPTYHAAGVDKQSPFAAAVGIAALAAWVV